MHTHVDTTQQGGCNCRREGNAMTDMTDDLFPWEALYRALVARLAELADQHPVPELAAVAAVHAEVCDRVPDGRVAV